MDVIFKEQDSLILDIKEFTDIDISLIQEFVGINDLSCKRFENDVCMFYNPNHSEEGKPNLVLLNQDSDITDLIYGNICFSKAIFEKDNIHVVGLTCLESALFAQSFTGMRFEQQSSNETLEVMGLFTDNSTLTEFNRLIEPDNILASLEQENDTI